MWELYYNKQYQQLLINSIMKKILFVAFAATLLAASCQKTEIINPVSPNGEPAMSFSTVMTKLTKAGAPDAANDGMLNLQEQNFKVWAYCAYDDPNTTLDETNTVYDEMEGLDVTYTPAVDQKPASWGTAKQYFWPGKDKKLQFFAVSSLNNHGSVTPTMGATPSLSIADFTVSPSSPNTDLMVADIVQQHQGDKEVNLLFHHALSKIEFVFKTSATDDITVFVQSLKVAGLTTNGTLNVTPKAPETPTPPATGEDDENDTPATIEEPAYSGVVTEVSFAWAAATTPATENFTDDYTDEPTDLPAEADVDKLEGETPYDKSALKLTGSEQPFTTWLMVPQSVAEKKIEVIYLINNRQFKSIFALDQSLTDKRWEPNQYIKYTINLSPNLISFNPTVKPWDDPTDVSDQN